MFDYKIIFTGPMGSGKTTAIHTYSEIVPVVTEVKATDETRSLKENTTVALDYGVVKLDEETKIHLYGTPGQIRFNFMWQILSKNCRGMVLLLDHTDPDPIEHLKFYLGQFAPLIQNTPVIVGINKYDSLSPHSLTIDDYRNEIYRMDLNIEVHSVDIRKEEDVRFLIISLLFSTPRYILCQDLS